MLPIDQSTLDVVFWILSVILYTLFIALLIASREALSKHLEKFIDSAIDKVKFKWSELRFANDAKEEIQGSIDEILLGHDTGDGVDLKSSDTEDDREGVNLSRFTNEKELKKFLVKFIPSNASYPVVKKHLPSNYAEGFSYAIAVRLAKKQGYDTLIEEIHREVNDKGITTEFELFDNILSSEDKTEIFSREVARRERSYRNGNTAAITDSSKKELAAIVDELTGDSKIIVVYRPRDYKKERSKAFNYLESDKVDTLFILGRGDTTLSVMNDIKDDIKENFSDVDFTGREGYTMETDYGPEPGKVLILQK